MKKILCMVLALLMCAAMLAGCNSDKNTGSTTSTPGTSAPENGEPGQSGNEDPAPAGEGIEITDNYTFTDPTDIEFDTRYVLYYGPDNALVMASADHGVLAEYTIIYAREEKAVAEYTLYVCDTAENAQGLYNEMESYALTPDLAEGDDAVIVIYSDEYALEANLDIFVMGELLPDTKASTYADFYIDYYGAEMME